MKNKANEIRKRIAKRKRMKTSRHYQKSKSNPFLAREEEKHGLAPFYDSDFESGSGKGHPLVRKDWLIFQIMAAICLFLIAGILFKNTSPQMTDARAFVSKSFEQEFQFATVASWYEEQFGRPLALLPIQNDNEQVINNNDQSRSSKPVYAVPANGQVIETFAANGQGMTIKTDRGSIVESIDDGFVIFAGVKDGIGKTVVIQHADGSEVWYGNLKNIDVKLYDFVEGRAKIGEVNETEDGEAGKLYLAVKKGDSFIDPNQVVPFE
jgi:stage IV sporulation protein FA